MPTWCAWCKPMRKLSDDPPGIDTHGICKECKRGLLRDLKNCFSFEKAEKAHEILGDNWAKVLTGGR